MSQTTSRRFFLGAATALAASRVWGANDQVNVAIIGLGGRGSDHLKFLAQIPGARVAGLCDIDQAAREKAQAALASSNRPKAKEFEDMRQAFADSSVEAVTIATPNHWHALAAIWAMRAGKDVYGEKPACHNIHEGQQMLKVARETGRMLQIGSQHRSNPMKIHAIKSMHEGLIGKIYAARGLCFKRRVSIGHAENSPTPPGVNWELFLGPAPLRPFNEKRFKYNWHWFWDTGNGDIGNQGVHEMGICRWALGDPEWPKTANATGGKYAYTDDQETPNTVLASYDYGGREIVFEVRGLLTGGEGTPQRKRPKPPAGSVVAAETTPPPAAAPMPNVPPINVMVGNLFYGTEGWAAMSEDGFQAFKGESSELIAEDKNPKDPDGGDPTTRFHMENFLSACRSRNYKELHDEIGNAYLSASLCHLANISYRVGRKLMLQPGPKFGDPEAEKLLTRDYRKPYIV